MLCYQLNTNLGCACAGMAWQARSLMLGGTYNNNNVSTQNLTLWKTSADGVELYPGALQVGSRYLLDEINQRQESLCTDVLWMFQI